MSVALGLPDELAAGRSARAEDNDSHSSLVDSLSHRLVFIRQLYDGPRTGDVTVGEGEWLALRFEEKRTHLRTAAEQALRFWRLAGSRLRQLNLAVLHDGKNQ